MFFLALEGGLVTWICSRGLRSLVLKQIFCFLLRCVMDDDNEVRDRATFYLNVLEQKQKALNAGYILNGNTRSPQTSLHLLPALTLHKELVLAVVSVTCPFCPQV